MSLSHSITVCVRVDYGLNSGLCVTGAVITLGKAQKFRFNHPAEAAVLRHERLQVGMALISTWRLGKLQHYPVGITALFHVSDWRDSWQQWLFGMAGLGWRCQCLKTGSLSCAQKGEVRICCCSNGVFYVSFLVWNRMAIGRELYNDEGLNKFLPDWLGQVLWLENKIFSTGLGIEDQSCGITYEVLEPLGGMIEPKEVGHWRRVLGGTSYSLPSVPLSTSCYSEVSHFVPPHVPLASLLHTAG